MSELSKIFGNAGEPHRIVHGDKVYSFALLDQVKKNAVEKRLYEQARAELFARKSELERDEYLDLLERLFQRYTRGEFDFLGKNTLASLQTPRGVLLLLSVLSGEPETALVPLITARSDEVNLVLKTILNESLVQTQKAAPNG